jgi:hypothetical protein
MANLAFYAASAQIFDECAKGKNGQGGVEKITEDNHIDEQITRQSGAKTYAKRNDNDEKNEDFHEHYSLSYLLNISLKTYSLNYSRRQAKTHHCHCSPCLILLKLPIFPD